MLGLVITATFGLLFLASIFCQEGLDATRVLWDLAKDRLLTNNGRLHFHDILSTSRILTIMKPGSKDVAMEYGNLARERVTL